MDKKFLAKAIIFNTAWVIWLGLSVFFGYLIAQAFFPDNLATFIPFSLLFIAVGAVPAFVAFRKLFRARKGDDSIKPSANSEHEEDEGDK